MKTKFELGEDVYVKGKVIRISLNKDGNGEVYDVAVKTDRGDTLSLNYISRNNIDSIEQR